MNYQSRDTSNSSSTVSSSTLNHHTAVDDRSVAYNNAAVRYMIHGNHTIALELFRGALESKLLYERQTLMRNHQDDTIHYHNNDDAGDACDDEADDDDDVNDQRCVTPDDDVSSSTSSSSSTDSPVAQQPISLYDTLDTYLEQSYALQENGTIPTTTPSRHQSGRDIGRVETSSTLHDDAFVIPSTSRGYEPYLYTKPFVVLGQSSQNDTSSVDMYTTSSPSRCSYITQEMSAMIVFNLGLIHQVLYRTSNKAASFYEIAATLLSSLPNDDDHRSTIELLRISLLNNFGVWCYENGEGESMTSCFEQLLETLSSCYNSDTDSRTPSFYIDPVVLRGMQANIQAFITPMNGISFAA